jgi:hypothetical protein
MKGEQNMTESEKYAEFNALICEAQALSFKADAMKVANREKEIQNKYPIYHEDAFLKLEREIKKIADKFRKLGGVE